MARVKMMVTLREGWGEGFQKLANLYGIDYHILAEKMLQSGVISHLEAIKAMQDKQKEGSDGIPEHNTTPSNVAGDSGTEQSREVAPDTTLPNP